MFKIGEHVTEGFDDPRPEPGDTAIMYGLRVLRQIIVTGQPHELSSEALAMADHAFPAAVQLQAATHVYDTLTYARHQILAVLASRDTVAREYERQGATSSTSTPATPSSGPTGHAVEVLDVPVRRPPSGMAVAIDF